MFTVEGGQFCAVFRLAWELLQKPVEYSRMDQRRGAALAVLRTTRRPIEHSRGYAARIYERLLEIRNLMGWNEVIFRAREDQDVLPNTIGDRREFVLRKRLQGFVGICGSHRPKCVVIGPRNARVFQSNWVLLHRTDDPGCRLVKIEAN